MRTQARTRDIRKQGSTVCQYRKQHTEPECVPGPWRHRALEPGAVLCVFSCLQTRLHACLGVFFWSLKSIPSCGLCGSGLNPLLSLATGRHWEGPEYQPREVRWSPVCGALFWSHAGLAFSYLWNQRAASCTSVLFTCKMKSFQSVPFSRTSFAYFFISCFRKRNLT